MQLKEPTLVENYKWVYVFDPAINRDIEDFAQLWDEAKDSGNWSAIQLQDGRQPVIWTLRHLRGVVRRRLQDMVNADFRNGRTEPSAETLYHAARFAIVGVENMTDHRRMPVEVPRYPDVEWGRELSVTPAWMETIERLSFDEGITGSHLLNEIGAETIIRLLPGKG